MLKFFIAHRVLASVLVGITPFAAFSLSGEVTGVANLVFVISFNGLVTAVSAIAADKHPGLLWQINDSLDRFGRGDSGAAELTEAMGALS